jgi:hypothetical protein
MREIKFRAWHKKDKKMKSVTAVELPSMQVRVTDPSRMAREWWHDNFMVLMQYTGLKDKNGVEIYEGDNISDGHITREVKYADGQFYPFNEYLDERDEFTILGGLYDFEVIGNIYEDARELKAEWVDMNKYDLAWDEKKMGLKKRKKSNAVDK